MYRADGVKVIVPVNPSWRSEIVGLFTCLRKDPYIVLLFPFFLTSNWFYTWQFNDYNGALFTLRTRALVVNIIVIPLLLLIYSINTIKAQQHAVLVLPDLRSDAVWGCD